MAAREFGLEITLVGDEAVVKRQLEQEDTAGLTIDVVHAAEEIHMNDHPTEAARAKRDSSMHVGLNLVKDKQADAFVTAGNTGALLAAATLYTLRRIRGVMRPALNVVFRVGDEYVVLADIGANVDCKPEWLVQFAAMAAIYSKHVLGVENPRVALLSNGEEEIKGNEQVKRAAELLRATPLNFIGNAEPKEVLVSMAANVVIHDGFVGNVLIKTYGATADLILSLIKAEASKSLRVSLGLMLAKPGLRRLRSQIDPMEFGGAVLLGVDGVAVSAHGRTNALGIKSAIRQACAAVNGNVVEVIRSEIGRYRASAGEAAV
jgi:glycerol-3-phosphate acyltransferase PlsX